MTLQTVKETIYDAAFRQLVENSDEAAWLKILRENAIDTFARLGFPGVAQEDWKYTNVAPVAREEFRIVTRNETIGAENLAAFAVPEADASILVFVNGRINSKLTNLSAISSGAVVSSLAEAARSERFGATVKEHLARQIGYDANGFTALNAALWQDGAFVFVPKNVKTNVPIQLLFVSNAAQTAMFPRVLIVLETGAEAVVVENYVRTDEAKYLTDTVTEIVLGDAARLTHYRVQRESHAAFHIGATSASLARDSFYDTTNINLGAAISRHDAAVKFTAEAAECFVDGLYLLSENQHADTHSVIDHALPNCQSHQTYKGVLNDRSRAVFNGKVFVRENASGTDAQQSNKNLLLSNDARVDTKPQLEIFNDDVKCAHGATVGQLEDEEVFYLLSRGLSPDLARNLLTYGFAEEVINKIKIESIKAQLDAAVLNRLNANF